MNKPRIVAKRKDLIEVLRTALDCPSHFHKPTIVNNDDFFHLGENAIVICDQCVERMREAIGLTQTEPVPCSFVYWQAKPLTK